MLGLPGDHILFVEDRLGSSVVNVERGVELAPAFDSLLVKVVGAALGEVEVGLEIIDNVEDEIDGAAGIRGGNHALAIAGRFKMDDSSSCRKNTPIHGIGQSLFLREAEARARRREDGGILAERGGRQR